MSEIAWSAIETSMGILCEGARRCTRQAVYIVRIHAVNHCHPFLAVTGDPFYLMCKSCTDVASWRIGEMIGDMYTELPDSIEVVECHCGTCGRRIMKLKDVLTVERLIP